MLRAKLRGSTQIKLSSEGRNITVSMLKCICPNLCLPCKEYSLSSIQRFLIVCLGCNQFIAGMMRQHKFLSGVVDKLTTDDGREVVSELKLV